VRDFLGRVLVVAFLRTRQMSGLCPSLCLYRSMREVVSQRSRSGHVRRAEGNLNRCVNIE